MDVALIDYWALQGKGPYHRASAESKVLATALVLAGVLVAGDMVTLLAIYLFLAAVTATSRLPLGRVLTIAAYPAVFGVLFAVSRWDGTFATPTGILLRAMDASLAVVLLIVTTPYPEIFSVLRVLMPRALADALFLSYRSLFILLRLVSELITALRIRGGLDRRRYVDTLRNLGQGLGNVIVHAVDLSERFYEVLRIRGYSGRLASSSHFRGLTRADAAPLLVSTSILSLSLTMRLYPTLGQLNGYILLAGLLALLVSYAVNRRGLRAEKELELWKR
jgi:cobalt/nickel transport system permease protein